MGLFGDLTVSEVRASGDDLLAEIVDTTKLPPHLVRRRLDSARGNALIRSVFMDEWPDLAGELANETVARAKAQKLSDKIGRVTGLDYRTVEFVLDQTSSRTRIHNAFDFAWPGKADRERREGSLRELFSNLTVGTIRQYDLFADLAEAFGLEEQAVRDDLSAHRANKFIKNIRSSATGEPSPREDQAQSVGTDEETLLSSLPQDGSAIGNGSLRDKIGWDEDKYFSVRAGLLQRGLIWLGRGRGGSVMLASGWVESRRKDLFVLVPEDGSPVSNSALMRRLGWEETFYNEIKKQLIDEGMLQVGRGRGGSVFRTMPSAPNPAPGSRAAPLKTSASTELFFCYSHRDEVLRNELEVHLASLRREGIVSQWHDRRISVGEDWRDAINEHIDRAGIVLLLVSPDFLASDYCYEVEVTRALNRYARGETIVIPVILRPCDWNTAPFARIQALPTDAKPITRWPDKDEAWLDVVRGIRVAVARIVAPSGK